MNATSNARYEDLPEWPLFLQRFRAAMAWVRPACLPVDTAADVVATLTLVYDDDVDYQEYDGDWETAWYAALHQTARMEAVLCPSDPDLRREDGRISHAAALAEAAEMMTKLEYLRTLTSGEGRALVWSSPGGYAAWEAHAAL